MVLKNRVSVRPAILLVIFETNYIQQNLAKFAQRLGILNNF